MFSPQYVGGGIRDASALLSLCCAMSRTNLCLLHTSDPTAGDYHIFSGWHFRKRNCSSPHRCCCDLRRLSLCGENVFLAAVLQCDVSALPPCFESDISRTCLHMCLYGMTIVMSVGELLSASLKPDCAFCLKWRLSVLVCFSNLFNVGILAWISVNFVTGEYCNTYHTEYFTL